VGKPRLPLVERMRRTVDADLKRRGAAIMPADRVTMCDLLTEAADRIELLESVEDPVQEDPEGDPDA